MVAPAAATVPRSTTPPTPPHRVKPKLPSTKTGLDCPNIRPEAQMMLRAESNAGWAVAEPSPPSLGDSHLGRGEGRLSDDAHVSGRCALDAGDGMLDHVEARRCHDTDSTTAIRCSRSTEGVRSRSYGIHGSRDGPGTRGKAVLTSRTTLTSTSRLPPPSAVISLAAASRQPPQALAVLVRPVVEAKRLQSNPSVWELDQRSGVPRLLGSRPTSPRFRSHGRFVLTQPAKQSARICPILPGEWRLGPEVRQAATRPRRAQYPCRPGEATRSSSEFLAHPVRVTRLHLSASLLPSQTRPPRGLAVDGGGIIARQADSEHI